MLKFLQEKRILRDEVPPGVRALTRDKGAGFGATSPI